MKDEEAGSAKKNSKEKFDKVADASAGFERWVAAQTTIVRGDLELKHRLMAARLFPFMRATFYRWAQLWPLVCPELARAPQVLAVGDLHVDNFGTWRDLEGRLVWGVNDFDEAWPASYAADLVRLVASAYLAGSDEQLRVSRRTAREAVEDGYRDSLEKGGSPYVLAERHVWLREIALSKLRDPVRFWAKVQMLPAYRGKVPQLVHELLRDCMPVKDAAMRMKTRLAGLGSLGKPRILALFEWHGAHVVREAKALTRSAWIWADAGRDRTKDKGAPLLQEEIISNAVRVRDPHLHFHENWAIRRLAPDCCRIDVASLPDNRDEERMLYAMGWETANVHLGSRSKLAAVRKDLAERRGKWLHKAAKAMAEAIEKDWKTWGKYWRKNHAAG